ncbi:hypothetical protein BS78_08G091400 [Paspalum vaginatum]|nr:hypothetical protein BS78_08G091400 [Paspalum vaginatum]
MDGNALQAIFKLQAAALQDAAQRLLDAVGEEHAGMSAATACGLLIDYIGKACALAAKLGLPEDPPVPGYEALSGNKGGQNVQTATSIAGLINQTVPAPIMHKQAGLEEDVVMEEAEVNVPSVAALFAASSPPLLNNQQYPAIDTTRDTPPPTPAPERHRRPRRGFNMSKDFVAMFDGPLPQHVIAALTSLFNLDNDNAEKIDQALAGLTGEGVAELQDAVQEMLTEAGEAAVPAVAA